MTVQEIKNSRVGKTMFYLTANEEMRSAVCSQSYYHDGLGKIIHRGTSPNGHIVKLTDSEIYCWGTEAKGGK